MAAAGLTERHLMVVCSAANKHPFIAAVRQPPPCCCFQTNTPFVVGVVVRGVGGGVVKGGGWWLWCGLGVEGQQRCGGVMMGQQWCGWLRWWVMVDGGEGGAWGKVA
nr:hypothetical protein [Tanacetum cinerariifolium]